MPATAPLDDAAVVDAVANVGAVPNDLHQFFALQETNTYSHLLPVADAPSQDEGAPRDDRNQPACRPSSNNRARTPGTERVSSRATTPKNASRRAVTPGKPQRRAQTPGKRSSSRGRSATSESAVTPDRPGRRRSKKKPFEDQLFLKLVLDQERFDLEKVQGDYAAACESSLLIPRRHFLDLVERGTDAILESKIALGSKSMGDAQARLLCDPMSQQVRRGAHTIDLQANRIGASSLARLASALGSEPCFLEGVNLSRNGLGASAIPAIMQIVEATKLVSLDLGDNLLKDPAVETLAGALRANQTLTWLELCKNEISRLGTLALAAMVRTNTTLTSLGLSWNSIAGESAVALCSALQGNGSLKTVDLSFNALGNRARPLVSQALSRTLQTNHTLTHLDLSHNHFGQRECRLLGQALNDNHSLMGLHLEGNAAYADSRGFLRPRCSTFSAMVTGDLRKMHANVMQYPANQLCDMDNSGGCWICGGWQERTFTCRPPPDCRGPAKLHISSDGTVEPVLLSMFVKQVIEGMGQAAGNLSKSEALNNLGMALINELGIETMADLDATTRDQDTLFDIEAVLKKWLEKWNSSNKGTDTPNPLLARALLKRIRAELPKSLRGEQHICGEGSERYPGLPMIENGEGDWELTRMVPPGTVYFYYTFHHQEGSVVAVAKKDDLTTSRLDALHAGMAAAYSNRLGNMWKSLGQPKAAQEAAPQSGKAGKKGRPMLLKAKLDKMRGQLNASATSTTAKAAMVKRQVRPESRSIYHVLHAQ